MLEKRPLIGQKILQFKNSSQTSANFCVGDSITFADIAVFTWKQFTIDPTFNKYGDIKSTLRQVFKLTPNALSDWLKNRKIWLAESAVYS